MYTRLSTNLSSPLNLRLNVLMWAGEIETNDNEGQLDGEVNYDTVENSQFIYALFFQT